MFAGQITGCEGYVESACVGFLAGVFASSLIKNEDPVLPPRETAFGSMLAHLQDKENIENYQPMNINFGLFPEIPPVLTKSGKYKHLKGLERKEQYCTRALKSLQGWLQQIQKH